jgi:hypothetical protein
MVGCGWYLYVRLYAVACTSVVGLYLNPRRISVRGLPGWRGRSRGSGRSAVGRPSSKEGTIVTAVAGSPKEVGARRVANSKVKP